MLYECDILCENITRVLVHMLCECDICGRISHDYWFTYCMNMIFCVRIPHDYWFTCCMNVIFCVRISHDYWFTCCMNTMFCVRISHEGTRMKTTHCMKVTEENFFMHKCDTLY